MTAKKHNIPAMIAICIFFFVIPHILFCIPDFSVLADRTTWLQNLDQTGSRDKTVFLLYLHIVWGLMPFSGSLIALFHVLTNKKFSLVLPLEAMVCILTFAFRLPFDHVCVLLASVLLMVFVESFALLDYGADYPFFSGMAKNKKMLALVAFCSVVPLAVLQIQGYYHAQWSVSISNVLLVVANHVIVPVIMVAVALFQQLEHPVTLGGAVATVGLYGLCMVLSLVGFNASNEVPELFVLPYTIGFALNLLVNGLMWLIPVRRNNIEIDMPK
jgi:hypothetical protein